MGRSRSAVLELLGRPEVRMSGRHRTTLRSPRLRRCLDVLARAGEAGATTWEISVRTGSCAPAADVGDLRAAGVEVDCALERVTEEQRKIYRYTLRKAVAA